MLVLNAGHACLNTDVLLTAKGWAGREKLLDALRQELHAAPPRTAFYGASAKRSYAAFMAEFPDAEVFWPSAADECAGALPRAFRAGVDPKGSCTLFDCETFTGTFVEVSLEAAGTPAFLVAATEFCNRRLDGSLNATVYIDPVCEREHAADFDHALAALEYGAITVNATSAAAFGAVSLLHGAYGGNRSTYSVTDCGTGNVFVHNTLMIENAQKCILRVPFRYSWPRWWCWDSNDEWKWSRNFFDIFGHRSLIALLKVAVNALSM